MATRVRGRAEGQALETEYEAAATCALNAVYSDEDALDDAGAIDQGNDAQEGSLFDRLQVPVDALQDFIAQDVR